MISGQMLELLALAGVCVRKPERVIRRVHCGRTSNERNLVDPSERRGIAAAIRPAFQCRRYRRAEGEKTRQQEQNFSAHILRESAQLPQRS